MPPLENYLTEFLLMLYKKLVGVDFSLTSLLSMFSYVGITARTSYFTMSFAMNIDLNINLYVLNWNLEGRTCQRMILSELI